VIPRSRRSLCKDQSFGGGNNAGINTSNLEWACKGRGLGGKKGRHTGVDPVILQGGVLGGLENRQAIDLAGGSS